MEKIEIKATTRTPEVNFDFDKGVFKISGNSMPENTEKFYFNLVTSIDEYLKQPKDHTLVIFRFNYYNTATARALTSFFKRFNMIHQVGKTVEIRWEYEYDDPDMVENAEFYQEMVDFTIDIIAIRP